MARDEAAAKKFGGSRKTMRPLPCNGTDGSVSPQSDFRAEINRLYPELELSCRCGCVLFSGYPE
jgi:hypothetical protein